jgi:hypothetical protein
MPLAKDVHLASDSSAPRTAADREAPPDRRPTSPSDVTEAEAHLIRLCLDLQLDAMLLTLGAAATGEASDRESTGTRQSPPWRRWVLEDVELARELANDVLAGGASLPATLGSDLDQAVPAAAVDNLVARYESMTALLADILPPGPEVAPAPYRAHAQAALAHYEHRLRDLRSTRLDHTPARGLTLPTTAGDHLPVPGEWLG